MALCQVYVCMCARVLKVHEQMKKYHKQNENNIQKRASDKAKY